MSCVIGLLHDGKVYVASDGIATTEDGEKRPIIATKVFTNKDYIIGFTGSVRTGQLAGPKFFDPPASIYDLPDALREQLGDKGSLVISNETQQHLNACNYILAYKGRLFEMLMDFQLNEIMGNFTAIGSGSPYAMGALFATQRSNFPERRLKTALRAACEYDMSCGLPYTIEIME